MRVIVKSGDDLRSEQFAMQLIETMDNIFKRKNLKLLLSPYEIISTREDCGLVELVQDSMSIDYLKQKMKAVSGRDMDLCDFYKMTFGHGSDSEKKYKRAINNLIDSLAAYSLVCYIL